MSPLPETIHQWLHMCCTNTLTSWIWEIERGENMIVCVQKSRLAIYGCEVWHTSFRTHIIPIYMLSKKNVTIHARLSSRTNGIVPMSNLFLFARKRDFIVQSKGIQSFMHSKSISFGPDLSHTAVRIVWCPSWATQWAPRLRDLRTVETIT